MADSPRPPYVRFEVRAVEDRDASIEAGHYVAKDVVYAIVTPVGSKDQVEKPASEWIEGLQEGVRQERIPANWPDLYTDALKRFEQNQEDPEFGTPLRNWAGLTPAQLRMLTDANIRSVEDVAAMNEEAVSRIGMGGRALKSRAQAWLDTQSNGGKVSEELASLRVEIDALKAQNKTQADELQKLRAAKVSEKA